MSTFADAMSQFRANAARYEHELTQEQLERELKSEAGRERKKTCAEQVEQLLGDFDAL